MPAVAIGAGRCYRPGMFDPTWPAAPAAAPDAAGPAGGRARIPWLRPALLAAGLVAAGWALRMLPRAFDPALLDRFVASGPAGAALFVVVAAGFCAVGLPRQAAAFAGGYAFGVAGGAALALLGQVVGCAVDFGWARAVARSWAARRLRGRLARWEASVAARPFRAVLSLRLLPVGNNLLVNLLAGASSIRVRPFLLASALGYVPQTIVFALLGGGVRVAHWVQIGLGAALFVASAGLGAWLLRARPSAP